MKKKNWRLRRRTVFSRDTCWWPTRHHYLSKPGGGGGAGGCRIQGPGPAAPPCNEHTISLSGPKGVVSLGMVLRVRLLEVGGSTGGALGKAFFPFAFFSGTRAVGGGAKRSTSESDD